MSRTILKYAVDGPCLHSIPAGSFLLDLQVQGDMPVMWWSVPLDAVNSEAPERAFGIAVTGGGHDENDHYVGTFQIGGFVGHVFSPQPVPRSPQEASA